MSEARGAALRATGAGFWAIVVRAVIPAHDHPRS